MYLADSKLWVREIDPLEARVLAPVPGGTPFWPPDSQNVAYVFDDKLFRVAASGGNPTHRSPRLRPGRGPSRGVDGGRSDRLQLPVLGPRNVRGPRSYDFAADGRILAYSPVESTAGAAMPSMIVTENWFSEFKDKKKK